MSRFSATGRPDAQVQLLTVVVQHRLVEVRHGVGRRHRRGLPGQRDAGVEASKDAIHLRKVAELPRRVRPGGQRCRHQGRGVIQAPLLERDEAAQVQGLGLVGAARQDVRQQALRRVEASCPDVFVDNGQQVRQRDRDADSHGHASVLAHAPRTLR